MRLGVRNSGNSIRRWTARLVTETPSPKLENALRQARGRRRLLLPAPDCSTKRMFLAREDWLIRCLEAELARRGAP